MDNDFLIKLILPLICCFLSTFIAKNLVIKIIIFLMTIIVVLYGYLSIIHETCGSFYRAGELKPSVMSVAVGHRPLSIILKIKLAGENRVIAENIELSKALESDERTIEGKLLKISLLSTEYDGFTIYLTNETGQGIEAVWIVKYNKLNDFLKSKGI